ncbi:MAG: hypothetical protein KAH03_02600 [Cocleimonas sp.]|nr:hypothetical protein [Cocleimonas sp.]
MTNFKELISTLLVSDLKKCLPFLPKDRKITRKADIVEYIYEQCKQHHKKYWQQLDRLEKNVVSEMLYQKSSKEGNFFNASRFKAKYEDIPNFFKKSTWGSRTPETSYLCLFIYDGKMPEEYREWMKTYIEKPQAVRIPTISEENLPTIVKLTITDYDKERGVSSHPKVKVLHTEEMIARDLETLLRFIESGQCAVSDKTNRATAVTLRKLDEILLGGDYYQPEDDDKWAGSSIRPIRSFALPLIVQAGGLAKRVGKKLQLTSTGKKALSAPLHKTVKTLYQRWRNKGLIDEFSRVDTIKGQASKGRIMTAVAPRRKAIETILQQCPLDQGWVGIDSLFQYIKSTDSTLEITHNEWKLYISDREYGALGYSSFHDFEILQGRYILAYFFEYLATMGLIDIAYTTPYEIRNDYSDLWGIDDLYHLSRYDGLLFFRINPLGAYCLEMAKTYQATVIEKSALLTIDEALHIHLLRPADPAETMILERYAKSLSINEWQLSESSLLQAMENHYTADKFQQFLIENSNQNNPNEELANFFKTAFDRENSLKDLGTARLLHCYSEPFAKMLASSRETQKYCTHAGGLVLVIPEKTKKQFMKGLHRLGYVYPQENG